MLSKIIGAAILLAVVAVAHRLLLDGGLVWLAGAVGAWGSRRPALDKILRSRSMGFAALALLIAALIGSKIPGNNFGDLALGLAIAVTLPFIANLPSPGRMYNAFAHATSEISYTLYLTHFPLLALIVLVGVAPSKLEPNLFGLFAFAGLMLISIAWAAAIWWCFERRTDQLNRFIEDFLRRRDRAILTS